MDKPSITFCGTKTLKFTVLGDPHGQMRARFSRRTGRAYTPKASIEAEANVRAIATLEMERQGFALMHAEMPVEVEIISYRPIPQGKPKWFKEAAKLGMVAPLTKPDASNVIKEIEDSLLGVVYHDDRQIFRESYEARYSDNPRAEVTITGYYLNVGEIKEKMMAQGILKKTRKSKENEDV